MQRGVPLVETVSELMASLRASYSKQYNDHILDQSAKVVARQSEGRQKLLGFNRFFKILFVLYIKFISINENTNRSKTAFVPNCVEIFDFIKNLMK